MTNSETVQAALGALRKHWMEMHGGRTPEECRLTAINERGSSDTALGVGSIEDLPDAHHHLPSSDRSA